MFTESQRQYMEEVLGTLPAHYRAPTAANGPIEQPALLVLTPALPADEQALLQKILGSIHLTDFIQVEALPENVRPQHILSFHGQICGRSSDVEGTTTWNFPAVAQMTGTGAQVAALKKETWTLLQQFQREQSR